MKYLLLFLLLPLASFGQSTSYMVGHKSIQFELKFDGKEISAGLIGNVPDESLGVSLTYHPIKLGFITPYFRFADGFYKDFHRIKKMYGYDFGIQLFDKFRIEHTNRHYIDTGVKRYFHIGFHIPL